MKAHVRRIISMVLVIVLFATGSCSGFAEAVGGGGGETLVLQSNVTWAQAARRIAGMLGYIVEDAANIDLEAYSQRLSGVSLEDDSVYLAILAEAGYLPEEPAQIDPDALITADEYVQFMEKAFPIVVETQEAADSLLSVETLGNVAVMGDTLTMNSLNPGRVAVAGTQQLELNAVKADALSLNAPGSVVLSESEIARVHINDISVATDAEEQTDAAQADEQIDVPKVMYLNMDAGTQLPEIIVKSADEVLIEGSGALGVVRVQERVGSLTVRATASVINETDEAIEVTGPDAQVVTLKSGEQVDFVLSKWLVSFVTEGTAVPTQEVAPGSMVDFSSASTELEGKVFTAWYEDAEYTKPFSRLSAVNKQLTLYARFVDESEAAIVTFETFGGRELAPMVFAKGEHLLTKPIESLYTSKDGYSFGGWCVDEECTTAFGYTEPIEESMTLYAMFASYEQQVQEDFGNTAQIELADGSAAIGVVLPEGMSMDEALSSLSVEVGTGAIKPELALRERDGGVEIYCAEGFVAGTTFTIFASEGIRFVGQPEYIDTLAVSIFREEIEIVEFTEGMTYVLWDEVSDYVPVSRTEVEYEVEYDQGGTEYNVMEDYDADATVIPGSLVVKGEVDYQPEQLVVFYDGEINDDESPIDAWEGGELAGYVLFAKIDSVSTNAEGNSVVTFRYADPEEYITELDVHTTEEVDVEEVLDEEQIVQVEKAIASQLASNEELKAQMLVAVMTSEDTQRMLDEEYGEGTYALAALIPSVSNPKLDINLSVKDNTATVGIGVGMTVTLYGGEGMLLELTPYLYFNEQLTLDINVDGGKLWIDMSVLFKTKTTIKLEITATTGGDTDMLGEAKRTLEDIVNADGSSVEGYDYEVAADTLMNTMQELVTSELEYQDLFAVPLLKLKYSYMGLITLGVNVELVGQAAVIATFGITVTTEYGQKIGFNYNFKKFKGGSYKEKLGSEVTTEFI